MTARRFLKARALLAFVLLATVASGCQFLQNEFFYLCPIPKTKTQDQQDQDSGLLPHRQAP